MASAGSLSLPNTVPAVRRGGAVPFDWLILIGFAALILLINPRGFIGGGTDDWQYLNAAECWAAHGPCLPTQHWATRWPLIAPLAAVLRTFGETRVTVGLVPLAYAAAATALVRHLATRLFDRSAGLVAGIAFLATPAIGLSLLRPNIDLVELTFLLAALAALIGAVDRRSRSLALVAGAMLALAVQSRETGFAYAIVAGVAFLRADHDTQRLLLWGAPGFILPMLIELTVYAIVFGSPFARFAIALHHTALQSSALAVGVDTSRSPLLDPAIIDGWRPVSGIDLHWIVNPVINLLAHRMTGPILMAGAALLIARRRTVPAVQWRAACRIFVAAAAASIILIYVLAIDPLPRMFLPLAAAAALAIGGLAPRSPASRADALVLAALAALLVIVLATIARQPTMLRAEEPATRIIATHGADLSIDATSRRALALVSGTRTLPDPSVQTRRRIAVAQQGCRPRGAERVAEQYALRGPWFVSPAPYRGTRDAAPDFALCLFERVPIPSVHRSTRAGG